MRLSTTLKRSLMLSVIVLPLTAAQAFEVDSVTSDQLLAPYVHAQTALVDDDLDGAQLAAKSLQGMAGLWLSENPEHAQKASVGRVLKGAGTLATVDSLDDARIAFVEISQGAIAFIRADESLKAKWQLFFCSMVAKEKGYWVQPKGTEIGNPYMGGTMPGCGGKKPW